MIFLCRSICLKQYSPPYLSLIWFILLILRFLVSCPMMVLKSNVICLFGYVVLKNVIQSLSTTNEIFSSIESPTLCIEVLQQGRTQDHIHHLHEIFHVQKRICTAAVRESTITVQLTTLWKQIVVLWTNLQSFFSHAQLHLVRFIFNNRNFFFLISILL